MKAISGEILTRSRRDERYFCEIQSVKLNNDETILMAGTEYFGQTVVQPRDHIPVNNHAEITQ